MFPLERMNMVSVLPVGGGVAKVTSATTHSWWPNPVPSGSVKEIPAASRTFWEGRSKLEGAFQSFIASTDRRKRYSTYH